MCTYLTEKIAVEGSGKGATGWFTLTDVTVYLDHPQHAPAEVDELDKALTEAGKEHEFHTYEGAGHAFFAVNRPAYRPEAAMDGWQKIWNFYGRYLAG